MSRKPLDCLTLALASTLCAALLLASPSALATQQGRTAQTPKHKPFANAQLAPLAQALASEYALDATWALKQLQQARHLPQVRQWVLPAAQSTAKNWNVYRDRFIEPRRLQAAQRFWEEHSAALTKAETQYGVPASLIVGVIGVETFYGQHRGTHRVLDALTTLALDFPAAHPRAATRQAFFRQELGELLRLGQQGHVDVQTTRGSFAGAMGWPQFMPSSWARYAVDFDADGKIDLINSPVDAIGSVANYFKAFGWITDLPTHWSVQVNATGEALATLLQPDIVPSFTLSDMHNLGAQPDPSAHTHGGKLALVKLYNGGQAPHYVAGSSNFYVVTRYNWSSYYALAVIELGERVREIITKTGAGDGPRAMR
jgi:membrane-bound lytic murein transglycosylase B